MAVEEATPSEQLQALLQEDFAYQLRDNPEFATQAGFHENDGTLQKMQPHSWDARAEHNKDICQRLEKLDTSGLSDVQQLYMRLFKDAVEGETRGIELGGHLMPLNSVGNGGVHESFLELVEWMSFETNEDFQKYANRLMAFQGQMEEFCDLLAYGACMQGRPVSQSMIRAVPTRLKQLLESDMAELRMPLKGKEIDDELRTQIDSAITHCFKGGLKRLLEFLSEFYTNRVRADPACASLRDGVQLYSECLRFHTTTTKSAQEIHDLGLQEVARIEERFQHEVLDVLEFKGNFVEFADSLKSDGSRFFRTEQELLDGYRALVARIQEKLPTYFKRLPTMPLEIVPKQSGPCAYYYAGTADGKRPGRFYVNISRLEERPRYEMTALALHEGVPGHHLQGALALENDAIPDFLRYIEDRRYEFCPARRPLYTGYLEGWALYCEHLGEEMGMYATPEDLFGRLSMEMMRAVRLVVDTGIHKFGWSVERAAKYMEEKTGMATEECLGECHRYAAWPGQACGYKVGQLAIEEMRARAEAKLGKSFNLPDFHDLVLGSGPLPLDVLAERVDAWAAASSA